MLCKNNIEFIQRRLFYLLDSEKSINDSSGARRGFTGLNFEV